MAAVEGAGTSVLASGSCLVAFAVGSLVFAASLSLGSSLVRPSRSSLSSRSQRVLLSLFPVERLVRSSPSRPLSLSLSPSGLLQSLRSLSLSHPPCFSAPHASLQIAHDRPAFHCHVPLQKGVALRTSPVLDLFPSLNRRGRSHLNCLAS